MSLIQEALQRQKEEASRGPAAPTPPPLPGQAPIPAPAPAHKPPREAREQATPPTAVDAPETGVGAAAEAAGGGAGRTQRPWTTLVGLLLVLLLLVAGAVWMVMFAYKHWLSGAKADAAAAAPRPVPTRAPTTPSVAPAASLPPTVPSTQPPAAGPDVGSVPTAVTAAPTPPAADHAVTAAPTPTPARPKPRVQWPSLTVTGIAGRGTVGSAMINGEVVAVGETIEGVTLKTIHPGGVDLEYKGDACYVKVGNATP